MVEMVETEGKMTKTNYIHGLFTLLLIIIYYILNTIHIIKVYNIGII